MITFFHAIILGLVEGATEFLPISSTFHLIMTAHLLGIEQTEFVKMFEVVIQSGAILAVVLLYAKELWERKTLAIQTIVAFLPTAVIGLALYKVIKGVFFESELFMITVFMLIGGVFILIEYLVRKKKLSLNLDTKDITWKKALTIGLFQSLAVVPGVSRAGAVIVGMMILGFKRDESAKFSFMLSIPTIFAATALDLFESREILMESGDNLILIMIGFITAFVSALVVIKWFISFLQSHTLTSFGIYRWAAGIIILILLGI